MKRTYRKRETFDAEQFFPSRKPWPEGVQEIYERPTLGSRGTPTGRYEFADRLVTASDWVVWSSDGIASVWPDAEFQGGFELVWTNQRPFAEFEIVPQADNGNE